MPVTSTFDQATSSKLQAASCKPATLCQMFFMFKNGSLFLLLPIGNRRLVRLNACGSNTITERIKMNKEKSLIALAEENNASPSMKEALKILDKWNRIDLAFRVIELTERVVDLEIKIESMAGYNDKKTLQ
jgi:hypothetical protein